MKKKIFALFLSILMVVCIMLGVAAPSAYAIEEPPELKSAAIYLADIETGYVYYERQANNQVYPASLTTVRNAIAKFVALILSISTLFLRQ